MAGENPGSAMQAEENATDARERAEAQAALDGNEGAGGAAISSDGTDNGSATSGNDTEGEVARGMTGPSNAGAASNEDATLKHCREIAGLDD